MKKILSFLCLTPLFILSCQKSISYETHDDGVEGDSTIFSIGDSLTYEVITKDTGGWFGIWTDANGELGRTLYDNGNWGSPVYNASGWKYSFKWNGQATQLMMSAATKVFQDSLTINLYKNKDLIKSVTNYGGAKVLYNIAGDTLQGTLQEPVLTYEVLIDQMDSTKNQYDAWIGDWYTKDGINVNDENYSTELFPIPSGWRYTFKPVHLPYTMSMQAWPYTKNGSLVTMNFYVNGVLVKTSSANDLVYPPMTYDVL